MSSFHHCDRFSRAADRGERDEEKRKGRDPRLENLIYSHPCLQLITSHLFHRGFTTEFLSTLLRNLVKDQSVTGVSPLQVLVRSDKKLLQVMPPPGISDPLEQSARSCTQLTIDRRACSATAPAPSTHSPILSPLSSHCLLLQLTTRRHYLPGG